MAGQREDYLSFETYFMEHPVLASQRSKDSRTQVGAAIIKDNHVISEGYNGTPKGLSDDDMPWHSLGELNGDILQIKNTFVVHAEANAIDHLENSSKAQGATMYVTLFPCPECAKRIVNVGIREVVYLREYKKTDLVLASKKIFDYAGVVYREYDLHNIQEALFYHQKMLEYYESLIQERKNREQKLVKIKYKK